MRRTPRAWIQVRTASGFPWHPAILWCWIAPVVCLLFLSSHGGSPTGGPGSLDVHAVHFRSPGSQEAGEIFSLSEVPRLVLGASSVTAGPQMWRVQGYVMAPDGSVAVLSAGTSEVLVFGPGGPHRVTFGRAGRGPGEFNQALSLALAAPDTLIILDLDGLDVFLLDGTHLESMAVTPPPNPFGPGTTAIPLVVFPDRSMFGRADRFAQGTPRPRGVFRPDQGMVVFPSPGADPILLGWYRGLEQEYIDVGGRPTVTVAPFARKTLVAFGAFPGSRFILADNDRFRIDVFDAGGALVRSIERDWVPVKVQNRWVEAWKEEQRGLRGIETQLPQLEQAWRRMKIPNSLPPLDAVGVDSQGLLWVLRARGERTEAPTYDILTEEGHVLGWVRVPSGLRHSAGLQPVIGDDFFLGAWTDEFGVEQVRVYGLRRGLRHP